MTGVVKVAPVPSTVPPVLDAYHRAELALVFGVTERLAVPVLHTLPGKPTVGEAGIGLTVIGIPWVVTVTEVAVVQPPTAAEKVATLDEVKAVVEKVLPVPP